MLLSLREARSCTGDSLAIPDTRQEEQFPLMYKGVTWRVPICGRGVGISASPSYQVPFFFFSLTHYFCPISNWLRAFKKQERKGSLKEGSLAATGCIQGGRCRQGSWRVLRKVTGQALGVPKDNHCRVLSDASEYPTLWLMCFLCSLWTVSMEVRCSWVAPPSFPLAVLWDAA